MNYFDLQCAISFHDDIISEIGGLEGYNKTQIGYLDSVLEQIQNDDYYSTFFDKMIHIIFSCVKFHPFLDGNKRTAIYLGCHFAKINGLDCPNQYYTEMENVVVKIAENSISKDDLKDILFVIFTEKSPKQRNRQ